MLIAEARDALASMLKGSDWAVPRIDDAKRLIMNDREKLKAALMNQFGPNWWLITASSSYKSQYLHADGNKQQQERLRSAMQEEAVTHAMNCVGAALAAGLVVMKEAS